VGNLQCSQFHGQDLFPFLTYASVFDIRSS
jgi:hypothetical protein